MENRLKVLRAEQDITQEQLAEAAGLSRQTIHSIERGKTIPSLHVAFKLARALDAAIDDVFIHEDDIEEFVAQRHGYR